jgi:hypothetical protein
LVITLLRPFYFLEHPIDVSKRLTASICVQVLNARSWLEIGRFSGPVLQPCNTWADLVNNGEKTG